MDIQSHSYQLSYAEWLAGVRFARRRNPIWLLRFILSWLIPTFLLYFLIAITWNAVHERASRENAGYSILVLGTFFIAIVGYRLLRIRRLFRRSAMARNEHGIAIAFDEQIFVAGLPGRSEGRFLWSALYDYAENERVALIYTSKKGFVVVPKHAMPQESWAILRTLVPQRKAKTHAD